MLVPLFAAASAIVIYRLNGKKEVLKLDLVQFFYAFVLAPLLFVWVKTILYVLLKTEVEVTLNTSQMFVFDTAFSVIYLYTFAFVVMHSLTKSFNLRKGKDPLYDIFQHSEYFHLWLTHLVIYLGVLIIFGLMSFINIFVPFELGISKLMFRVITVSGFLSGLMLFAGMWLSDPKQGAANFMRIIKLVAGLFFVGSALSYFIFDVPFSPQYVFYWSNSFSLLAFVLVSFFAYKSERAQTLIERAVSWFKHHGWDFRIELFEQKRGK